MTRRGQGWGRENEMTELKPELKKCPFCGGLAYVFDLGTYVSCYKTDCPGGAIRVNFKDWQSRPVEDALRAELAALRAAAAWHPASEPPPTWKTVLLLVGVALSTGFYTGSRYAITYLSPDAAIADVTHWRELPAPPEGEA